MAAAPASLLLHMADPQRACCAAQPKDPYAVYCPQADGDALRAAAGSLNAYAGDGSFMEQFERQQEAAAAAPPPRCPPCSLLLQGRTNTVVDKSSGQLRACRPVVVVCDRILKRSPQIHTLPQLSVS